MSTWIILQQMAVIAILVLTGVYLYKKGVIDSVTSKKMSTIVMDVVNPALVMSCVITGDMDVTHKELLQAVGVGIALYVVLGLLGMVLPRALPIKKEERKFYNMMTVYTNVGFIGIPLAKAVLSDSAMLYVIICNVMYCLMFYTHGVQTLSGKKEKIQIKRIFSPGTVMSVLTLVMFWFDIKLPAVLADSIVYLGNATVFMSMCLLGASIAKSDIKDGLKEKSIWLYILLRMILVPVVLVYILKLLGFEGEMVQAFCLMAAMPVANLPLIQAEKTGEDTVLLSRGITITTLVSFVTITVVMSILF